MMLIYVQNKYCTSKGIKLLSCCFTKKAKQQCTQTMLSYIVFVNWIHAWECVGGKLFTPSFKWRKQWLIFALGQMVMTDDTAKRSCSSRTAHISFLVIIPHVRIYSFTSSAKTFSFVPNFEIVGHRKIGTYPKGFDDQQ